jgi:hypothetical protein
VPHDSTLVHMDEGRRLVERIFDGLSCIGLVIAVFSIVFRDRYPSFDAAAFVYAVLGLVLCVGAAAASSRLKRKRLSAVADERNPMDPDANRPLAASMTTAQRSDRDWLAFVLLGVAIALGYGLLGIDVGGPSLSSQEAWARGVAQPYVASGVLLVVLAALLRTGSKWVRWLIVVWLPLTILGGMSWAHSRGVGVFNAMEFFLVGVPLMIGWVWVVRRMLFVHKSSEAP